MQPIETIYDGYRFRSRLEARWAVFFKYSGIRYIYEPEGFRLADGTTYLPDFYLPDYNTYVEIKSIGAIIIGRDGSDQLCFESGREDANKYVSFLTEVVKTAIYMILIGDPYDALQMNPSNNGGGYVFLLGECLAHILIKQGKRVTCETGEDCGSCNHYSQLLYYPFRGFSKDGILIATTTSAEYLPKDFKYCDIIVLSENGVDNREDIVSFREKAAAQVQIAQQARSARFEHNETP